MVDYSISDFIGLGVRPQVTMCDSNFLVQIQEEGMRQLISNFYDLLIQSEIKQLFPQTQEEIKQAKQNSSDFFIQVLGGTPYFNQNRGRPMMAARHAPFAIDKKARLIWLNCFKQVIEKLDIEDTLKQSFWNYIDMFSMWMINR